MTFSFTKTDKIVLASSILVAFFALNAFCLWNIGMASHEVHVECPSVAALSTNCTVVSSTAGEFDHHFGSLNTLLGTASSKLLLLLSAAILFFLGIAQQLKKHTLQPLLLHRWILSIQELISAQSRRWMYFWFALNNKYGEGAVGV